MYRIELPYLKKHGLLKPGRSGTLSWSRGGQTSGSINYRMADDHMLLDYRTRPGPYADWRPVEQRIAFDWTTANLGGRRRWFLCPACDRRCATLYAGAEYACRQCHRLVYGSQYEDAMQRAITRALDVKAAMGDPTGIDDGFPLKPKGMHWRTYLALEAQFDHAQNLFAVQAIRLFNRLEQRL